MTIIKNTFKTEAEARAYAVGAFVALEMSADHVRVVQPEETPEGWTVHVFLDDCEYDVIDASRDYDAEGRIVLDEGDEERFADAEFLQEMLDDYEQGR